MPNSCAHKVQIDSHRREFAATTVRYGPNYSSDLNGRDDKFFPRCSFIKRCSSIYWRRSHKEVATGNIVLAKLCVQFAGEYHASRFSPHVVQLTPAALFGCTLR